MQAILMIDQCFSRASWRCSSYNMLLGSFSMNDLHLWDLCQDDIAPGEFLLLQCACHFFFAWAHQLMYVHDQLLTIVSSSGMLAMLGVGSGPSMLL
jgi:hypothetical protein